MRLSNKALQEIADRSPAIKSKLALALDCSEGSINRYLRENEANNDLTKIIAIQIIIEETGLSEAEILEESAVEQNTN